MFKWAKLVESFTRSAVPLAKRFYHNKLNQQHETFSSKVNRLKTMSIYHKDMAAFKASTTHETLTKLMSAGTVPKHNLSSVVLQSAPTILSELAGVKDILNEAVLGTDVFIGLHASCLYSYVARNAADIKILSAERKVHQRAGREGCLHIATGSPLALKGAIHYAGLNASHRDRSAWQYLFKQSFKPASERDFERESETLSLIKDTHLAESVILLVMYRAPDIAINHYDDLLQSFKTGHINRYPLRLQYNPNRAHLFKDYDTEVVVHEQKRGLFKTVPVAVIGGNRRVDFNTKEPTSLSSQRFFAWPSMNLGALENKERVFIPGKGFMPSIE